MFGREMLPSAFLPPAINFSCEKVHGDVGLPSRSFGRPWDLGGKVAALLSIHTGLRTALQFREVIDAVSWSFGRSLDVREEIAAVCLSASRY